MGVLMTINTSFSFYTENRYKKNEAQISKKLRSRQAEIEKQTLKICFCLGGNC